MTGLAVRTTDPDTSAVAAGQMALWPLMDRVLDTLRAAPQGLTDDEIAARLPDAHPGSVSKRRCDLTDRGLVRQTDRRRPTRYGRPAIVWEAVR